MRIHQAERLGGLGILFTLACGISGTDWDGPRPQPASVARVDTGFPVDAVLCGDLGGTLQVSGSGFSPMPVRVLTDQAADAQPKVVLVSDVGTEVLLTDVQYAAGDGSITAAVPALAAGTYDIVVRNPNHREGRLAAALELVAPPTLTGMDPVRGPSSTVTPVLIDGAGFRVSADGSEPSATLTLDAGGPDETLTGVKALASTQLAADVPANLLVGLYTLTVTNPEGCSARLASAFEVTVPPVIDLCASVTPSFGWINARTTLEICANNAAGNGLVPVPEAFVVISDTVEVALIREAFMATSIAAGGFGDASLMSAVVPSSLEGRGAEIAVGGPYAIRVVNPNGASSIIPNAFTVLPEPPPRVTAISPEQAETSAAVTLQLSGANFKDPAAGGVRLLLLTAPLAAGAACAAPTCFECAAPIYVSSEQVACNPPLAAMPSGAYLLRYEHLDDGSYSDFAAFSVTNPSGNLAAVTAAMPALSQARFGHAATFGRDDLGSRFVWAAGGQSGVDPSTALSSIEVASLSSFGALGEWALVPSELPMALSGLNLVRAGSFLFAIGGVDATNGLQASVHRAQILGSDSAPMIRDPQLVDGGGLAAGTYLYQVAAIMSATDADNAGGEGLPSDIESLRIATLGSIRVRWDAPVRGDVAYYRIYRSATADASDATTVLVADGVDATEWIDDGSNEAGATTPLFPGALGAWMEMPPLGTARALAGAAVASDGVSEYLYVLGGITAATAPAATDTYEVAQLSETGATLGYTTFLEGGNTLQGATAANLSVVATPRAEHIAVALTAANAPLVADLGKEFVVTSVGRNDGVAWKDSALAAVMLGGELGEFVPTDYSSSQDRYGAAGFLANNFLFTIGGRSGAGGYDSKGRTTEVCPARDTSCASTDPPVLTFAGGDSGISLAAPRYRHAGVYVAGYFYLIGGRADNSTVLGSVERGSYQ